MQRTWPVLGFIGIHYHRTAGRKLLLATGRMSTLLPDYTRAYIYLFLRYRLNLRKTISRISLDVDV